MAADDYLTCEVPPYGHDTSPTSRPRPLDVPLRSDRDDDDQGEYISITHSPQTLSSLAIRSLWHYHVHILVWFDSYRRRKLDYPADGPQGCRLTILHAATQRQSGETMTSVSAGHIILTPCQPVESGREDRTHNLLTRSRTL